MSDPYKLSRLLHLFLDLYEKGPELLYFLEDEAGPYGLLDDLNATVRTRDQYNLLLKANRLAGEEVLRKTLIQTSSLQTRHEVLRSSLDDFKLDSTSYESTEEKYRSLPNPAPFLQELKEELIQEMMKTPGTPGRIDEIFAKGHGISADEYRARKAGDELSAKRLDSEILRFFADRLDQITTAIETLEDTEFNLLIPDHLVIPFRELHINAALGNYGTTLILCGTLLERTLQDLLPSKSVLSKLIQEAKADDLLVDKYRRYADRIRDDRNKTVHGEGDFAAIGSADAWETVRWTRDLVSKLYEGRLDKK